jgi:hypothetical protein
VFCGAGCWWEVQQAGNTALIQAAAKGHGAVVSLLVASKASVTAANEVRHRYSADGSPPFPVGTHSLCLRICVDPKDNSGHAYWPTHLGRK